MQGNYTSVLKTGNSKQFRENFPVNYVCLTEPSINHVELVQLARQGRVKDKDQAQGGDSTAAIQAANLGAAGFL